MASPAEEVVLERIAPFVRLVCQLHVAALADVAVHVEVLLHGNHADSLLRSLEQNKKKG